MALIHMPAEILLTIAKDYLRRSDMSALSRCCQALHSLLNRELYRRAVDKGLLLFT